MHQKEEAIIYLEAQRGISQTDWFRSFHTFNFGAYQREDRTPFGALQVFNDDTLVAGKSLTMQVEQEAMVILLPIVGGIEVENDVHHDFVGAGEALVFNAHEGITYQIGNPFEQELVNFLQIWLFSKHTTAVANQTIKVAIDINNPKNQLLPILDQVCYIGQFDGREEGVYTAKAANRGIFIFVIEGAFEVQNRLLHSRDGLSLTNTKTVDFEALSNHAIILFVEMI
jgi:quercetin 2,3-dioxygenase